MAICSRHAVDDLLHNLQLCPSQVPLDAFSPQAQSFSPSLSVLLVDTSHRWEAVFTHFFVQPFKVQISILPDNLAVQIHKLVFRSCQIFGANYKTANQDGQCPRPTAARFGDLVHPIFSVAVFSMVSMPAKGKDPTRQWETVMDIILQSSKTHIIHPYSGVARGGAGGANAPYQIFVVPLLPKTPICIGL